MNIIQKYVHHFKRFQIDGIFVNSMDFTSIRELKGDWENLVKEISLRFDVEADLQGILFLIGVQELGQGKRHFTKDEKQDLFHIATCRLLSIYGFYELAGTDESGWPHWQLVKKLPPLSLKEQDLLLKQAILDYFKET